MHLWKELYRVTDDNFNQSHHWLVASFMTFSGNVNSMSQYTMRTQPGALSRAAFEEPVDMLVLAALNGERDNLSGCSSPIVCGIKPQIRAGYNFD